MITLLGAAASGAGGGGTPPPATLWTNYEATNWRLNGDNSLEATASTVVAYQADVIPQFSNIGDWMEFEYINSNPAENSGDNYQFELSDGTDYIRYHQNGTLVTSDFPQQFVTAYHAGDVMKIEKIGANSYECSVNGGTKTTINQTLTGVVSVRTYGVLTIAGVRIAEPVTNIP